MFIGIIMLWLLVKYMVAKRMFEHQNKTKINNRFWENLGSQKLAADLINLP